MIILSKIGWPSVGGWGGASANNATGCLTHSRTHCSNQVASSNTSSLTPKDSLFNTRLFNQFCRLATEPIETLDFALDIDDFFS